MTSRTRTALAALVLTLIPAAGAAAQSAGKFAFVNSQKLLPAAPGIADVQATIETEGEGVKAQEQKMSDSLQAMFTDYQKLQPTLTPAQRTQHETAINKKRAEYQQRAQQLESRAQAHQAELIQPIMEQLRGIIEQLRVEGGFSAVFDVGNQTSVVVAWDSTLDMTDKVIAKLATAGPPPKGGAKPVTKPPPTPSTKPTGVARPPRGR